MNNLSLEEKNRRTLIFLITGKNFWYDKSITLPVIYERVDYGDIIRKYIKYIHFAWFIIFCFYKIYRFLLYFFLSGKKLFFLIFNRAWFFWIWYPFHWMYATPYYYFVLFFKKYYLLFLKKIFNLYIIISKKFQKNYKFFVFLIKIKLQKIKFIFNNILKYSYNLLKYFNSKRPKLNVFKYLQLKDWLQFVFHKLRNFLQYKHKKFLNLKDDDLVIYFWLFISKIKKKIVFINFFIFKNFYIFYYFFFKKYSLFKFFIKMYIIKLKKYYLKIFFLFGLFIYFVKKTILSKFNFINTSISAVFFKYYDIFLKKLFFYFKINFFKKINKRIFILNFCKKQLDSFFLVYKFFKNLFIWIYTYFYPVENSSLQLTYRLYIKDDLLTLYVLKMAFFRRQCLAHLLSYWKKRLYEESSKSAFDQQSWLYEDFDSRFSNFTKVLYSWSDGQDSGEGSSEYEKNMYYYHFPHASATEEIKKKWDAQNRKEKIKKYGSWSNWLDYSRRQSADIISTDNLNWELILDETDFFYERVLRLDIFQTYYIVSKGFPIMPIFLLFYRREEFDNFNFVYYSELDYDDNFPYFCDIDELIAEQEEEARQREEARKNYKNLDDEDD